jgi:hypothetical protein
MRPLVCNDAMVSVWVCVWVAAVLLIEQLGLPV